MAQPRDWRGRWTSGGSSANPAVKGYSDRRGSVSAQAYKGRPKVSVKRQQQATVQSYAASSRRRVGAPVGGNKNLRLVSTRTKTKNYRDGGSMTSVRTRGSLANRRAARTLNRTGKAPAGSFVVAYNPKG